ncbi:dihydrofolate reductase family protein [Blastopirellula sp. JC732]|uniref:Dihydrofolate reductase family protein n=1 Tax=Blastopirellula sediminis TaxID=2894196 RepID=A0A9X1SLM3_9BACT|nr:dihydrofolate reductase family protein [Blastopirellula sediminis]MCC9605877.1 dihydrofolate reductase family protein [Blastopirellula sediminis]MCC9630824.1 dihydrofolate reductase family protein [Blastopirellula sediminis]
MKTQFFTATSLDGFIADADHSLEWLFQFGAGPGEEYEAFIRDVGVIAMGSHTYEWLLRHMAVSGDAWYYEIPTWVFTSRTLPIIDGADIRFVSGDVRPVHEQMEAIAGEKNLWITGGGELVGQFYDAGLLDDLFVQIAPVTLGSGMPLLPRKIASPPLRLVSCKTHSAGFLLTHYQVVYDDKTREAKD